MAHKKIKGSDLHLSVSKLSRMTKKDLRKLDHLRFVVTKDHETLAILIPYGQCQVACGAAIY